jgi:hypothetical protein
MSLSISEFKGRFVSGARPNLYSITIPELGDGVEFLAKASSLPPSTIGQIEVPFRGRQLKVAGNRTFQDWTVTVLNDINFAIRGAAEAWMDRINGHQNNTGYVNISDYMVDARVEQLSQDGSVLYTYTMKDIWPTEIGEVDLAFDNNDAIEEFTITFVIGTYWQSDRAVN